MHFHRCAGKRGILPDKTVDRFIKTLLRCCVRMLYSWGYIKSFIFSDHGMDSKHPKAVDKRLLAC